MNNNTAYRVLRMMHRREGSLNTLIGPKNEIVFFNIHYLLSL